MLDVGSREGPIGSVTNVDGVDVFDVVVGVGVSLAGNRPGGGAVLLGFCAKAVSDFPFGVAEL